MVSKMQRQMRHFEKRVIIIFLISVFALPCISCGNAGAPAGENEITIDVAPINEAALAQALAQSSMPDGGYRFATAAMERQFSVYATYYIRKAKESARLTLSPVKEETKEKIVERFLNISELDITDLYCAACLLGSDARLSDETKENISSYLDSIYDAELGCYLMFAGDKSDPYRMNIYSNHLIYLTSELLDIEIKPIDGWIKEAVKNIFDIENIVESNSTAYVRLYELAEAYNIEIPADSVECIKTMFQNSLDSLDTAEDIYLPVYLEDYLVFCGFADIDSSESREQIIGLLCDEKGLRENTFHQNDVIGLSAAVRALELAQYDFESHPQFNEIFAGFDAFMLEEDSYIQPCFAESNFVDTYYADALVHALGLEHSGSIREYCESHKQEILQRRAEYVCYYLKMLQRNGCLEMIENDRENIINGLLDTLDMISGSDEFISKQVFIINEIIKGLDILGEERPGMEEVYENIVSNYVISDNELQRVYDLSKLTEFVYLVSPNDKKALKKYCQELEEGLMELSAMETSNKIMLYGMALDVLTKADYSIAEELEQKIKSTLNQSQDDNGLYKGGDSDEDVVTFRDIYDAIMLYSAIG